MADSNSNIQQIIPSSGAAEQINENFDAASPAMLFGRDATTTGGLTWGFIGGRWVSTSVSSGTVTLDPNSTLYLTALRSTGAVSISASITAWDNSASARLYKITTSASAVTAYEDHRAGPLGLFGEINSVKSVSGRVGDVVLSSTDISINDYPSFPPSMLIDFSNSRSIDSRLSAVRAGSAMATNFKGVLELSPVNAARLDYNPITGKCFGALVEQAATNLHLYSETFSDASWSKIATTITANTVTAPDGTATADEIFPSSANSSHSISCANNFTSGQVYVFSLYVKRTYYQYCAISLSNSTIFGITVPVYFDLDAVSFVKPSGYLSASIDNVGSGWYRISVTASAIASGTSQTAARAYPAISMSSTLFNGSVYTGSLPVWGAQLETEQLTSYIKTTSAQVTRLADTLSLSGINLTKWLGASGTVLAKYKSGWVYNNTLPSSPLDLAKSIVDYSTPLNTAIERVLIYPRVLTSAQRIAITA